MKKKKQKIMIFGIILTVLIATLGVSFALWQVVLEQTNENVVNSSCFKVNFSDTNPIELEKSHPITDIDGMKLTPYEFTITNTCDAYASYQINLEILDTTTLTDLSVIKMSLNEEIKLLINNETVSKTLSNASSSYKLQTGYLNANESKTFTLRLWMDESTPPKDEYMNKVFKSKITVVTSYLNEKPKSVMEQNLEYILSKAVEGQIIEDDETIDHNLRYIGASPNNYVSFNNELWRIIGVMNNVDNGTGKKESRIKLIRNESIGEFSFDTSDSEINYGWGVNNWSQSDLMKLLNPGFEAERVGGSLYWNRGNGTCYNDSSNATIPCEFTNTGLKDDAKKGIEKAVWHLGDSIEMENAFQLYNEERGDNSNGTVQNKWTGIVGLLYPSDFYLSTSGAETESKENCLKNWLGDDQFAKEKCYKNSWIYKGSESSDWGDQWTITPVKNYPYDSYYISNMAFPGLGGAYDAISFGIYPSVYLKSNVKIISGEGTVESPFILNLEE